MEDVWTCNGTPAVRFEFEGICEILGVVEYTFHEYAHKSSLFYIDSSNSKVFYRKSVKHSLQWSWHSDCFMLNPIDILEGFQFFEGNVLIWVYGRVNYGFKFFIDILMLEYFEEHHGEEIGSSVGSS